MNNKLTSFKFALWSLHHGPNKIEKPNKMLPVYDCSSSGSSATNSTQMHYIQSLIPYTFSQYAMWSNTESHLQLRALNRLHMID